MNRIRRLLYDIETQTGSEVMEAVKAFHRECERLGIDVVDKSVAQLRLELEASYDEAKKYEP